MTSRWNRARRPVGTVISGLVAVAMVAVVPADAAPTGRPRCSDSKDGATRLALPVEGEKAMGHVALPAGDPKSLVVAAHGYGHTSYSWVKHLTTAADRGVIAVAMDYRGLEISPDANEDGLPESRGWPALTGAQDTLEAARAFEAACPTIETVVILGVSMGGNMSGLAVAMAGEQGLTKSDSDDGLIDYWFDIEGAVNLVETYMEARAAGPATVTAQQAQQDIERETGGTFEEDPDAYLERTVVARTDDLEAARLDGVVMVHALNDGLVPYNQSRELVAQLVARGIATDMFTVTTRDADSEKETTITGYATDQVDDGFVAPFAGHASEKSNTHIVMNVAFERLWALLEGATPGPYSEYIVYGTPDDKNPKYVPAP